MLRRDQVPNQVSNHQGMFPKTDRNLKLHASVIYVQLFSHLGFTVIYFGIYMVYFLDLSTHKFLAFFSSLSFLPYVRNKVIFFLRIHTSIFPCYIAEHSKLSEFFLNLYLTGITWKEWSRGQFPAAIASSLAFVSGDRIMNEK